MIQRNIRIIDCVIKLSSNNSNLINRSEYFTETVPQSLLNDFLCVESVTDDVESKACLSILDSSELSPLVLIEEDNAFAYGDFTNLEEISQDHRFSLLGTQGLLYRFALTILERHFKVVSFHSCSIYDETKDIIWIIVGASGAGKTPLLLSSLLRGYKLFSTELTHFRTSNNQIVFYKGGLCDNVRLKSLSEDFPNLFRELNLESKNLHGSWNIKASVDFSRYQTTSNCLINPEIRFIIPRIESQFPKVEIGSIKGASDILKVLFENASEKIAGSFLLYGMLPVCGLDTPVLTWRRFAHIQSLIDIAGIDSALLVTASPQNCGQVFETE